MNCEDLSYKIRPGILYRMIADAHFLIATGDSRTVCPVIQQINSSGAYYWQLLEQGVDFNQMLDNLQQEHGEDAEVLRKTLERFLIRLEERGYVIRTDPR